MHCIAIAWVVTFRKSFYGSNSTYPELISLNIQLGALFVATLGSPVAEATAEAAPTADADAEADPHYFYYGKRWCLNLLHLVYQN